jgi:hypothetical protein
MFNAGKIDHDRAATILEFGRKLVDDAENQPTVLEGRSLVAEDDNVDVDADVDDERTKRPSKFVRQPAHRSNGERVKYPRGCASDGGGKWLEGCDTNHAGHTSRSLM